MKAKYEKITVEELILAYEAAVKKARVPSMRASASNQDSKAKATASTVSLRAFTRLRRYLHLVGVQTDTCLSGKMKVSRGTLIAMRQELCIKTVKIALWTEAQHKKVREMLLAGQPLTAAAKETGLNYAVARRIAEEIGWSREMVDVSIYYKRQAHTGSLSIKEVVRLFNQNNSLTDIAKAAGVTHERIRQIVTLEGLESRRTKTRRAAEIRKIENDKAKAERRREREHEKIIQLQMREKKALTLRLKRRALARKNRMARRVEFQRTLLQTMVRAQKLWNEGVRIRKIADTYGVSKARMAQMIRKSRETRGWFKHRRYALKKN